MLKTLLICLICGVIAGVIVIAYILLVELGKLIIKRKYEKENDDVKQQKIYICDAERNESCSKSSCYLNGGDCWHTTDHRYAIEEDLEFEKTLKEEEDTALETDNKND